MSEIAKTSLIDVSTAYSIGKLYCLGGFRSAAEVFQAKIRSQHAVWMPSGEVDALFPVIGMIFTGIVQVQLDTAGSGS